MPGSEPNATYFSTTAQSQLCGAGPLTRSRPPGRPSCGGPGSPPGGGLAVQGDRPTKNKWHCAESPRQGRCFFEAGASKTERRILLDGFSDGPRATNSREEWPSSAIGTSDGPLFNRGGDCRAGNLPAVRRVASVSHLLVVLVAPVPATAGSVAALTGWGRFPTHKR